MLKKKVDLKISESKKTAIENKDTKTKSNELEKKMIEARKNVIPITEKKESDRKFESVTIVHKINDFHPERVQNISNDIPKQTALNNNVQRPKPVIFGKVKFVPELSPAGKAALEAQESGDYEYMALLNRGFETPKMVQNIVGGYETNVMTPKKIQYLWHPLGHPGDANLWQNVEYHKYGNNLFERHKFVTPAKFTINKYGNTIVHAPPDSKMRILKRTPTISSFSNFLDLEDENALIFENNNLELE